jgi:hypothetical protein
VVEHFSNMHEAPGCMPSPEDGKRGEEGKGREKGKVI